MIIHKNIRLFTVILFVSLFIIMPSFALANEEEDNNVKSGTKAILIDSKGKLFTVIDFPSPIIYWYIGTHSVNNFHLASLQEQISVLKNIIIIEPNPDSPNINTLLFVRTERNDYLFFLRSVNFQRTIDTQLLQANLINNMPNRVPQIYYQIPEPPVISSVKEDVSGRVYRHNFADKISALDSVPDFSVRHDKQIAMLSETLPEVVNSSTYYQLKKESMIIEANKYVKYDGRGFLGITLYNLSKQEFLIKSITLTYREKQKFSFNPFKLFRSDQFNSAHTNIPIAYTVSPNMIAPKDSKTLVLITSDDRYSENTYFTITVTEDKGNRVLILDFKPTKIIETVYN